MDYKAEIEHVIKTRSFYQPIVGFLGSTKHNEKKFRDRLEAILDSSGKGSFLIGGSNIGYNAFEIVRVGGNRVVGVEVKKENVEFCNLLAKYHGFSSDNPLFVNNTIHGFLKKTSSTFDYSILLMVFHHIFKEHLIPQCLETMSLLATKSKYTFLSSRDKPWMKEKLNITYKEIPEYLIANTEFTNWEEIPMPRRKNSGVPDIAFGLPIWKLWKES